MLAVIAHLIRGTGGLLRRIDRICKPQKVYFACGTCERSLRCGRPPDPQCVVRAMQLSRDDNRVAAPLVGWPLGPPDTRRRGARP